MSNRSPPPSNRIEHWGPSLAIAAWAKKHGIPYDIPDWETVRQVNSKIFSFSESLKLPGAELLSTEAEVGSWIDKTPGPKVLKTAFGTAGKGHFHVGRQGTEPFLKRQFALGLAVIGEPWVERLFDFSTQWRIGSSIEYIGSTAFENEPNGTYLATLVGCDFAPFKWALEEHLVVAKPLLEKIRRMGYFGNLGIDAYVYRWEGKEHLQPIVEINGRKTMSWVALQVGKERFSYSACLSGLLPECLQVDGKTIRFSRNIICT